MRSGRAYDLAQDLQAKPLLVEIETLAQTARVTLSNPPAHVRGAPANQPPGSPAENAKSSPTSLREVPTPK
jgi:hypothetical protein